MENSEKGMAIHECKWLRQKGFIVRYLEDLGWELGYWMNESREAFISVLPGNVLYCPECGRKLNDILSPKPYEEQTEFPTPISKLTERRTDDGE